MTTYKVSKGFIVFSILKKLPILLVVILMSAGVLTLLTASIKMLIGNTIDINPSLSFFILFLIIFSLLFIPTVVVYSIYWCKSFVFSITDDTLNMKGGILRRIDATTNFAKITDVTIYQDIFGRLLKYAIVRIQTAGSYIAEVVFFGIDESEATKVRDFIYTKILKK
jgi:uncharacterized membrane protein YdbT with pleckstrin-like domain